MGRLPSTITPRWTHAFFELIPNLGWATGDINFDGEINFDDYAVVDQAFFNQTPRWRARAAAWKQYPSRAHGR